MKQLLIGQLANLAGVKRDTVRFYERSGLLPKPQRMTSGYRVYDEAALSQVRFIRKAQSLGFSLAEIRRILSLRGQGRATCRCVLAMAEVTLSETESRLKQLREFRDALAMNLKRWNRQARGPMAAEFCALIESTTDSSTHLPDRSKSKEGGENKWLSKKEKFIAVPIPNAVARSE
jgi:MerR family copper efflux transcriptional regulator